MSQPERTRDFIGPYRLGHQLGGGAFSTVYQAHDPDSGRVVAVKLLEYGGALSLAAFRTEFQSVQGLYHPNIVRLEALLEHDGWTAIVMELVPGTDLLSYARPSDNDGTFDEARLRSCFVQLASALAALHAIGVVHRDIKPQNVQVTPEGRVVLFDFGLIKHVHVHDEALDGPMVGTADYNAPEQVKGGVQGPAADLYALGVCLFEAVAGVRPFAHRSPFHVMKMKQERDAPQLSLVAPNAPSDLHILSWRLLQRDPLRRPTAREVVDILAGRRSAMMASVTLTEPPTSGPRFVGRDEELSVLRAALLGTASGPRLFLVEGESGVGKSALVAEALEELEAEQPTAWIGRSRCYENERLPLKAFDGAMAFFGRKLSRLSEREQRAFLPAQFAALAPLFPALVAAPHYAPPEVELPADPAAKKHLALEVLALLLERMATLGPVVLAIDDLQWADIESLRLLDTLSRAEHGPLLVATLRPRHERPAAVQALIDALVAAGRARLVSLSGLDRSQAQALAQRLLGPCASEASLQALVRESQGHPLWLQELARFAAKPEVGAVAGLTLDGVIGTRIEALTGEQKEIVELVALAAQPYATLVLARALGLDEATLHARATPLLASGLLRRRGESDLACFHDRVRAVAAGRVGAAQQQALHAALARALSSQPRAAQADIARHFDAAALHVEALAAYHRAGDHALATLAFDDAAHHYRRALELAEVTQLEPSLVTTLRMQRGHALARGGHSAQAAQQYFDACEHADETQRIELRVWAAKHLLQSAQVEAGLTAARELLAELGVTLPKSQGGALARVVWDRICLGVSGLEPAGKREVSSAEHTKLNAMWDLAAPVGWVEMLLGATLSTHHLRASLAIGDRTHVARALAAEGGLASVQKPDAPQRATTLFQRARALYDAEQDPALEAWLLFNEANAAVFRCEFAAASEQLGRAEELLRARCPEEPWLLTNVRCSLATAWWMTGRFGAELATIERWLSEAAERDDRFAVTSLETVGQCSLRFLLREEPERVRDTVRELLAPWPHEPFAWVHLGELLVLNTEASCRGGEAAWQYLEAQRARHQQAFLLKTNFGKTILSVYRAQAALAAYFVAGTGPSAATYLRAARTTTRALRRSKVAIARVNSPLLDAQLAIVDGDPERALELTRTAARETGRLGWRLLEAPLGYLEGLLVGGDSGQAKRQQALALAADQHWQNPRHFVAIWCPVIDYLEAR